MIERTFPPGPFPDVSFLVDGTLRLVTNGTDGVLRVHDLAPDLHTILSRVLPGGYGRSDARVCGDWVAYRLTDALGSRARLYNVVSREQWDAGVCHGNWPVAVSSTHWAYQTTVMDGAGTHGEIYRAPLTNPLAWEWVRMGAPTGIASLNADGSATLVDETFTSVVGMTQPAFAPGIVVGEERDSGTLCRLSDGREALVWVGQPTTTPHVAFDIATGRYAIAVWTSGAFPCDLVAILTDADFGEPKAVHADPAIVFDMMPFFVGGEWPHTSRHNDASGVMDCLVNLPDRPHTFTYIKWQNPLCQGIYRYDDDMIYHHEGRTDELSEGGRNSWHLTDGRWVKRLSHVGDVIDCAENRLRRFHMDGTMFEDVPWRYIMIVEAHYSSYPFGGDIGTREAVCIRFDPTWSNPHNQGAYERFFYAKGWGDAIWESREFHGGALRQEARMVYRGGARVMPSPLIVPLPGQAHVPPAVPLPTGGTVLCPGPADGPCGRMTGTCKLIQFQDPTMPDRKYTVRIRDGGVVADIQTMDGRVVAATGTFRPVMLEHG